MKNKNKTNQPLAYLIGTGANQLARFTWSYRAELVFFGSLFALGWASTQTPWFVSAAAWLAAVGTIAKYREKVFGYIFKSLSGARLRRQLTRAARDSGFDGLRVGKVSATLPGEVVSVRVPRGQTADKLDAAARAMAGCLRVSDVRVIHDRNDRSHADLSIIRRDPFQQMTNMQWPLFNAERTNVREPMPMGLDEYGRVISARMLSRNMLVGGSPDAGKALALDTPIPTPSGWTDMGNLKAGDTVFDEQGKQCRVTDAWATRYDRPCYEVEFSDGSIIVADAEHQWLTWNRSARDHHARKSEPRYPVKWASHRSTKVHTTEDVRRTLKANGRESTNHSIPCSSALQILPVSLPIDPWVLGYLLGNGDENGNGRVACHANDREWLLSEFSRLGVDVVPYKDDGHFGTRGMYSLWSDLGLTTKHVPAAYLRGSFEQRLALVQGLVDSDGGVEANGCYSFVNTNSYLIDAFVELTRSLGCLPRVYGGQARLDTRNGNINKPCWKVSVAAHLPLARMARKTDTARHEWKYEQESRFIINVRPVDSVPVRCIAVDSPSHLFLAGEAMIPTHNSSFLRMPAAYAACDPMARLFVMDGKRVEFEAWRPCATGFVSGRDLAGAVEMLTKLYEDVDRRYQKITAAGEVFVLDDMKIDFLMIDELPVYTRPAINADKNAAGYVKSIIGLLYGIIAQGRAAGVVTILSAQKPDANTVPTEIRDLIDNRFALHCNTRAMSDTILGSGSGEEGPANAADIPAGQPGVGYYVGDDGVRKTKAFFMTHKQALEISSRATGRQIDLEMRSLT